MRDRIRTLLAFVAGVCDGLGWLRARDWLASRIEWTWPALDAFDVAADSFVDGVIADWRDEWEKVSWLELIVLATAVAAVIWWPT